VIANFIAFCFSGTRFCLRTCRTLGGFRETSDVHYQPHSRTAEQERKNTEQCQRIDGSAKCGEIVRISDPQT
jgi:hypothetical protein